MDYRIIADVDSLVLEEKIKDALADGWHLLGGLVSGMRHGAPVFAQAVVRGVTYKYTAHLDPHAFWMSAFAVRPDDEAEGREHDAGT